MTYLARKHITNVLASLLIISFFGQFFVSIPSLVHGSNYVDVDSTSFLFYKQKIESAIGDVQVEFATNKRISDGSINNLRSLIGEGYNRLPDRGEAFNRNENLRKSAELALNLAQQNKESQTRMDTALREVANFISQATIEQITGEISATPSSGNAPLTVSFLGTAKDPSGTNIPDRNFVWWMREAGGFKRELGRSPGITYTFSKEGTYQVFLDVSSESRNKKGRVDVSPLSLSYTIDVLPKLGNVILLVNGINVSNTDKLKVNPTLAKLGLVFDATASRAASNGTLVKTEWNFGNGETKDNSGSPNIERQIYANPGTYDVTLDITTNQGQKFSKKLQLLVVDPAAVINLDKDIGFIGESITMSTKSFLSNTANIEYTWDIQDENGKKIISSKAGSTFRHTFTNVGQYLITLNARNPNGSTDTDSKIIVIESREPKINLSTPVAISPEKPNTIKFDASKSIDPDTKSTKGLQYEWAINGEKVRLNNLEKDGAIGTYTFSEVGEYKVEVTVSNTYGKVSKAETTFNVASTLTVGLNINPRATVIGNPITIQAISPQAKFYEWSLGDGSPSINGTADAVENIYKTTGVYDVTLTVKNADNTERNSITRKVYITDSSNPFALIDIRNSNNSSIEEPGLCEQKEGAFVVNRLQEGVMLDGSNSINVDGNRSGLTYTWRYLNKIKTGPTITEKFTDLGCFPVQLTVTSQRTGASHTSTRYIEIRNIPPKITSVDAVVDGSKRDTQKLVVNVTANGAIDDDGLITSYVWYYTTESDQEKQNVRITQSPNTTFVLPNVNEKYYFDVIVEDNDGTRYDSSENRSNQSPLIIANDNANIYMPLISLSVNKTQLLTEEIGIFSVTAKDILGNDITSRSEYFWDFDGDGRIDQKTNEPRTTYGYKKSGRYNMRVKVTHNGSSNTKYQVINVKNELKADIFGYKIGDILYFLNASQGSYSSVEWKIGGLMTNSLYGTSMPLSGAISDPIGSITVEGSPGEISTKEITSATITTPEKGDDPFYIQTFPKRDGNTITLPSSADKLIISLYGNTAKKYAIDSDLRIDSDLDGIGDNDVDNAQDASIEAGSPFLINTENVRTRTRDIKITLYNETNQVIGTKNLQIIFDYIKDQTEEDPRNLSGSGVTGISESAKKSLDALQEEVKKLNPEDRIIFTRYYNGIIDGWDNLYDRTEGLLLFQTEVIDSKTLTEVQKERFTQIIDEIIVGDAQAVNDVSVALGVIDGLIPQDNPNRPYIIERIEKIKSHPGDLSANKILGEEILSQISDDTSISTQNKLLIKTQLLVIVNGGQGNVSTEESVNAVSEKVESSSGILGFIIGAVKIFAFIIGILILLFVIGYIAYRVTRKNDDVGFQDFLIDSIAHARHPKKNTDQNFTSTKEEQKAIYPAPAEKVVSVDPLESIGTPNSSASLANSYQGDSNSDPLSRSNDPLLSPSITDASSTVSPPSIEETHSIPDWLKPPTSHSTESTDASLLVEEDKKDSLQEVGGDVGQLHSEAELSPFSGESTTSEKKPPLDSSDQSELNKTGDVSDPLFTESKPFLETLESDTKDNIVTTPEDITQPNLFPEETKNSEDTGAINDPLSPLQSSDAFIKSEDFTAVSNQNTSNATPPESDYIPDWLKPVDSPSEESQDLNAEDNTLIHESEVLSHEEVKPFLSESSGATPSSSEATTSLNPENTDLPDWLKEGIDVSKKEDATFSEGVSSSDESSQKSSINQDDISPVSSDKSIKSGTKRKSTEKKSGEKTQDSSSTDTIPDWLK